MSADDTAIDFLDPSQPRRSAAEIEQLLDERYGIRGDLRFLESERDQAVLVGIRGGPRGIPERVVLKISNARQADDIVDLQTAALRHVERSDPALPVSRVVADREGRLHSAAEFADGSRHRVHVLSFLPGTRVAELATAPSAASLRNIGANVARLDRAWRGFFHPAAAHDHPWDFAACLRFRGLTPSIAAGRSLVESVFESAEDRVVPALTALRRQLVHHDAHGGNLLLADDGTVSGLLDFGDLLFGTLAAEVAIPCEDLAGDSEDLVAAICSVAAGYDSVLPLEETEIELLYDLVCLRSALVAVIAAARMRHHPDRRLNDLSPGPSIATLARLRDEGRAKIERALRRACRFPVYCPRSVSEAPPRADEDRLVAARAALMGRNATHFYDRPLHFERARGPWLYSTDGYRYLDCYNNVPQVGHCHPHVTQAIARQAAALNTNTRYLYGSAVEYADRLTAKLAPQLTACLFVNSGSEANDVAWQMAKLVTGRRGAIIMEDAYHGVTDAIRPFSPGHPAAKLPPHVKGILVPDPYRGPFRDDEAELVAKYSADADRAITELDEAGFGTAAFLVDSAFCSSGVPRVPQGYLQAIEAKVRAAGGLFIGDEVQSGFGRMGEWWGHEHHGVTADIVTMGKPVGNGHPIGVVVTTQDILNRFIDEVRLFSTFGGNTVACAAGNAVLDVIETENLIENGRVVGEYLRDRLDELAGHHELIGDVRGHGMITGVEFVTDRGARTPATAQTRRLLELMRQNRVLVGSDGRDANIFKLRPCLSFSQDHADIFIAALDRSLRML